MSRSARKSSLFTLLPLVCAAGAALAEDAELNRLLPLSLEELFATPVVTASRHAESRTDSPSHIMVITRDQIRERRYRNLADLLEDLPGVDFQRGTKSSAYNFFAFQGHVSNQKLLILLDGVRIDNPSGGRIPVADNFNLYHARQVEVLYGPAAALYGADAFAGVINIITDQATATEGAWVSVGGGSFDSRDASVLAGVRLNERMALTVGGHRQAADRARLDKYYKDDFPRVDAETFAGDVVVPAAEREHYTGPIGSESLYARLDVGNDLTLGYYRNHFHSLTSTGDRPDTALYRGDARWNTNLETLYGKYRFELSPSLSGELLLDYSSYEVHPRSRYFNVFTDFANHGYDYARSWRREVEQSFNWRLNESNTLLAGIGYKSYYGLETPDLPQPYDRDRSPGGQGLTYVNTDLPIAVFDAEYRNTSAYLQWQSVWSPDLSTMVGARYDRHSSYGDSLNPRLGLVWRNAPGSYLKLLYGEAFRAPSPDESFSTFGTFSGEQDADGNYLGSNFRSPNFNLEPETSRSLSLTWDWRPRPNLNLIVNAYATRVDNLIVTRDESNPTQYIPGAVLSDSSIKDNAGSERHKGADLIVQWRYRIDEAWSGDLWGSYSFVDGDVRESEGGQAWEQTNIARHKVKLGTTLRYRDRYSITPRLYWIGDTTTGRKDRSNPGERITTPGYFLANLHFGAHKLLDGHASAYLDILNLFDRRYYAAHGSASSTFVDMPQQPRTFMLSLDYHF